jgi:N-acetylneuraminic acid mutarotase
MNIRRNTPYFIEIADWQAGGNAIKTLDISLQIDNYDTFWQTVSSGSFVPTSRHASVVIGSNIYLLGGRNGNGNLLNNFQKLDTTTGTWQNIVPGIPNGGLLNTTAVYLPSPKRIYMPGGSIQSSDQAYTRDHQIYDFNTGIWDTASTPVGGGNVFEAFAYAAAAPNNANDGYFLTGGIVGPSLVVSSTVRDQVLFYQPATDQWTVKKEMTSPRYGHVAANVGGRLCVAGGLNTNGSTNVLIPDGECASGISPSSWASIGNMMVPRYYAHSSVGPDGRWYIYGGIDGTGAVVPEVEVYDPATNSWSVLGVRYDLGGQDGKPVVWPGGGFVGNYLWMAGGSFDATGASANPQVAKVQILGGSLYLPVIFSTTNANNHSFTDAVYLPLNNTISQNFPSSRTLVNVYRFELSQVSTINVALTGVASDAVVNLYLFGDNKDPIQSDQSPFPGIDKSITLPLGSGTYYVMVRYLYSTDPNDINDYYQLRVSN